MSSEEVEPVSETPVPEADVEEEKPEVVEETSPESAEPEPEPEVEQKEEPIEEEPVQEKTETGSENRAGDLLARDEAAKRIPTVTAKGVDLTDSSVLDAYCKVRSDFEEENWLIMTYGDSQNKLTVTGTGNGGYEEFAKVANSNEPFYAYLRYIFGDTDRAKFIFITYIPDSLPGMKKMRVQNHKADVDTFLKYYHIGIPAMAKLDYAEKAITLKLKQSGGADYGTGSGGGSRGKQNFGNIKNQAAGFYSETEKKGGVEIVYEKGPLSTTPCDLAGRPMVASATDAKKNTNLVGNLDSSKIVSKKK